MNATLYPLCAQDGWLAALPSTLTERAIELTSLSEARSVRRLVFAKLPSDKSFPAAVYPDGSRLPGYRDDLGPDTPKQCRRRLRRILVSVPRQRAADQHSPTSSYVAAEPTRSG